MAIKKCLTFLFFIATISKVYCAPSITLLEELKKNEFIIEEELIKDAPWPKYTIKTIIDAKTINAAAIFSAYDDQKNYVPGVISSVPVKEVTSTNIHVAFEMYMPWPLSNTFYTTGNILEKIGTEGFQVKWYYVKSDSTKNNEGRAVFIPYENKTILTYSSFIYPSSSFASFVSGKVKGNLLNTIKAIKNYIENTNKTNPSLVQKYINRMNESLSGRYIYSIKTHK